MFENAVSEAGTIVTAGDALRQMTQAFAKAGLDTPAADARLLVPAAIGISKHDLIVNPQRELSQDSVKLLALHQARRLAHEPVSRILGSREFYGRTFTVTLDTLDPRPDSETLVEAALEIIASRGWQEVPIRILDIGTGTGCLLLTLLAALPFATGVGTDISAATLDVAAYNARNLGLEARVDWHQTRSLEHADARFDLVMSNPPYIPTADLMTLAPEVRLYDPTVALDGGADGLRIYREIVEALSKVLHHGAAIFEVGAGQAASVCHLLSSAPGMPSAQIRTWQDLGGHTRCVALVTHQ